MPIFLPKQSEIVVAGDGAGFISITETEGKVETIIWLSIEQFKDICNQQDFIVDEAIGLK
jgi:hypothetical protein